MAHTWLHRNILINYVSQTEVRVHHGPVRSASSPAQRLQSITTTLFVTADIVAAKVVANAMGSEAPVMDVRPCGSQGLMLSAQGFGCMSLTKGVRVYLPDHPPLSSRVSCRAEPESVYPLQLDDLHSSRCR